MAKAVLERMENICGRHNAIKIEPSVQSEWTNFIRLQDLVDGSEKYLQKNSNSLCFCVKVELISCVTNDGGQCSAEEKFQKDLEESVRELEKSCVAELSSDIANLFMAGYNADFVVQCGGKSFPLHKPILVGKSIFGSVKLLMWFRCGCFANVRNVFYASNSPK